MMLTSVAERLGIVPTGVAYYFRYKDELTAECFLETMKWFRRFIDHAADAPTPADRLGRFFHAYFEHSARVRSGESAPLVSFHDLRTLDDAKVDRAFDAMFGSFQSLVDDGSLDSDELAARSGMILFQAVWIESYLGRYDPDHYGRAADRVLDVLEHGLVRRKVRLLPISLDWESSPAGRESRAREIFLRSATELIIRHGYLGASVEKISAELNVTKGSFYYHNEGKNDLVADCFDLTLDLMHRVQREADRRAANGLENLLAATGALVSYQLSDNVPLLPISAAICLPEALQRRVAGRYDRLALRLATVVSEGIADGSVRIVDPNLAGQMILATINAPIEVRHWSPELAPDAAIDLIVKPLFTGLIPRRTPGAP